MPKLGDMLGGIYDDGDDDRRRDEEPARDETPPAASPSADDDVIRWAPASAAEPPVTPEWASDERLDEAFADWAPGPPAEAPTDERDFVTTADGPSPVPGDEEVDVVLPAAPPPGMGRNTLRIALSEAIAAAGNAEPAKPVITPAGADDQAAPRQSAPAPGPAEPSGAGLLDALAARGAEAPAPPAEPDWWAAPADDESGAEPQLDAVPEPVAPPTPPVSAPAAKPVTVPVFDPPPPPPPASSRQQWVRGADDFLPSKRGGKAPKQDKPTAEAPKGEKAPSDDKDQGKKGLFRRK